MSDTRQRRPANGRKASENTFQTLFEHSTDAMLILDNGNFTECNPSALRLMGCAREDLLNVSPERISPEFQPDGTRSAEKAAEMIGLALEKGSHRFEWVLCRPNGEHFYVEVSLTVVPFEDKQVLFTVWRDITYRKKMEISVRESEERYRNLFDSLQDGVFVIQDGIVQLANASASMISGYDPEELVGASFLKVVAPEDQQAVADNYRRRQACEDLPDEYTLHILQKDGQTRVPVNLRAMLINYRGRTATLGTLRNLSEKLRMEAELREREEQYRTLFNSQQDGVFVAQDGHFRIVNDAFVEITGFTPAELVNQPFTKMIAPEDQASVMENHQRRLAGEPAPQEYTFHIQHKEGDTGRVVNMRVGAIQFRGRSATMGTIRDISEQLRAEAERSRMEKELQEMVTRRGYQVQLSTEIAQDISSAPALDDLFDRVVTQIKERLGYYHVQLLRYEPAQNAVVLVRGYGETGARMLAMGHHLQMRQGLIGLAAATGQTVLRPDISEDPDWIASPMLPDTRGEVAVPIKYGDRLMGVLDVQSSQKGALSEDDRLLLEGLCGQIAIAMDGTLLRQEMQERLNELNALYRATSHEGWESFRASAMLPEGYMYDGADVKRAESLWVEEIQQAVTHNSLARPTSPDSAAVAPLEVRGEVIGAMGVYADPQHPFSEEELALIEQVSGQVALALESARLFEQTRVALDEAENLYSFGRCLSEAQSLEEIIGAVVQATGILAINRGILVTFDFSEEGELRGAFVKATWYSGFGPELVLEAGAPHDPGFTEMMLVGFQKQEPVFLTNDGLDPRNSDTASLVAVPLWVGSQQFGTLLLETSEPHAFTEEEQRPISSLGQQAAIAIQSRLLFEETVESEARFRNTSEQLGEALNVAKMANWVFDLERGVFIFNDTFYRFLGTTVDAEGGYEMPAAVFAQKFVHPDDAAMVGRAIQVALDSTDPDFQYEASARQVRVDGQVTDVIVRFRVEKDEQGRTVRLLGANQDVTEQRRSAAQMESQRRTLQAVLDNMPAGVLMVEAPSGRPILSNRRAEEFLGRGISPDTTGDDLSEVYQAYRFGTDDLYPTEEMPIVAGLFGKSLTVNDMEMRRPDGSRVLLEVTGTPIYDAHDAIVASLAMFQDITERYMAQEMIAKRAVELATVAEVSTRVATIQSPNEMLQTVVNLTKQAFGLYHAHVYLLDDNANVLSLTNGAGEIGRKMVAQGRTIALSTEKSLVARAARTRQGVIVNDVTQDPDFMPYPLLPDTRSEMAVPMIVGESLLGVIDIQSDEANRFTPEDVNIMTTLAAQVAVSLQNARSYSRAQRQAEREALINAISERIQTTNSIESALQVAVREVGRALGAQHTAIRLELERKAEETNL